MRIVVDAYAWVEIFVGSGKGGWARETLVGADEAFTPDVVMAEVARKYAREGMEDHVVVGRLKTIVEASEIATINLDVAVESAKCYMGLLEKAEREGLRTPSLFDAIILATARVLKAKVLTGDEHLKGLPETEWIG